MTLPAKTPKKLRPASKKAELHSLAKDIMIYTEEGYVFIDLETAREIAEYLPIYIKKASKGITDKEDAAWFIEKFSG